MSGLHEVGQKVTGKVDLLFPLPGQSAVVFLLCFVVLSQDSVGFSIQEMIKVLGISRNASSQSEGAQLYRSLTDEIRDALDPLFDSRCVKVHENVLGCVSVL